MAQTSDTAPGGMRPWLRLLLVASLALNLLILGVFGGAMIMHGKGHPLHPPRLESMGGPLTRALSQADRRAIGREMRKAYGDRRVVRTGMQVEMEALITGLKAVPFDIGAVADPLARHRARFGERQELGQTLLLERLSGMDDAGRAAYTDRLQEVLKRHRKGKQRPAHE